MKKFLVFLFTVFLFFSVNSFADIIINPDNATLQDNDGTSNDWKADLAGILGCTEQQIANLELYKLDIGGSESGSYNNYYSVENVIPTSDPAGLNIVFEGGTLPSIPSYLFVKDGNANPNWYFYNLSNFQWNGTDLLKLQDFWIGDGQLGRGAISHVSLYGTSAPVPEPATMLLLGSGLVGLAGFGRKKFKR
jgi:hypothetical protein